MKQSSVHQNIHMLKYICSYILKFSVYMSLFKRVYMHYKILVNIGGKLPEPTEFHFLFSVV